MQQNLSKQPKKYGYLSHLAGFFGFLNYILCTALLFLILPLPQARSNDAGEKNQHDAGSPHPHIQDGAMINPNDADAVLTVYTIDPPADISGDWECAVVDDGVKRLNNRELVWKAIKLPEDNARVCTGSLVRLRRTIRVIKSLWDEPLGIGLGPIHGAYTVKVDGTQIGIYGTLDPLDEKPFRGAGYSLPPSVLDDGVIEIEIDIANYADVLLADPFILLMKRGPLLLGRMPEVADRAVFTARASIAFDIVGAVAVNLLFILVAMYHGLIWLMRPSLRGYLWFGLMTLFADTWLTIVTISGTELLPLPSDWTLILNNLVGSFVNVVLIQFFWYFVEDKPPNRSWRIAQYILMAIAFVGFIPQYGISLTVSAPVIVVKLGILPWCIWFLVNSVRHGNRQAKVILVGLVLAVLGAPIEVYVEKQGIFLPINPGQIAFLLFVITMAIALAAQFSRTLSDIEARTKELAETNEAITRFVPYGFLHVLSRRSVREVQRGDSRLCRMAVLFCDIRGFTTLAESLGPAQTFGFLNEYLGKMEPHIHAGGGFVNQYYGDGLMALFQESADGALRAAIGMQRSLVGFNQERAQKNQPPVKIGVGMHMGQLMLGTIGGGDRLDASVIGDPANTTSRIEGMTKMYQTSILLSGELVNNLTIDVKTYLQQEKIFLRHIDDVKAKGRNSATALYEVVDTTIDQSAQYKQTNQSYFENARALYRAGKFTEAGQIFSALIPYGDGASQLLAERCRGLEQAQLLAQQHGTHMAWDGIYQMTEK